MPKDWWWNVWANAAGSVLGGVVLAVLSALTVLWLKRISLMRPPEFDRLLRRLSRTGRAGAAIAVMAIVALLSIALARHGDLDAPTKEGAGPMQIALVACVVFGFVVLMTFVGVIVSKALRWIAEELHGRWVNLTIPYDRGDPKDNWQRIKNP